MSERTRQRVIDAAEELHFRPNQLAKTLRTGRSSLLAFLAPDIGNPFYTDLAQGVISAAKASALHVLVAQTSEDVVGLKSEVDALLDHQCGAFIFTAVTESHRGVLEHLTALGVPFIQLIRRLEDLEADFVGSDDVAGGMAVAEHLLGLGHRDIAVIAGPATSSASRNRLAGLINRLNEDGVRPRGDRVVHGDLSRAAGHKGAVKLLSSHRSVPTAIACGNDVMALGAIDALFDAGLDVPCDVSVVGYDDMSFTSARQIGLTTIHQPQADMGRKAVLVLLDRLAGSTSPPVEVFLPHHLVVRTTTTHPRSEEAAEVEAWTT